MLDIDGVRVLEARHVDGEVELTVETTTDRDWCRACGVRAHSKRRPTVVVRDVTAFGRRARLRWRKRRWRCPEPACPTGSWTQQHPALRSRMTMTERARVHACRRVGKDAQPVAVDARDAGVGWHTIMRTVIDHGQRLVDDRAHDPAVGDRRRRAGVLHHRWAVQRQDRAINALMKKMQRIGHGFRNLRNYRLRLLLHCGGVAWQDQPAARLRKRAPRKAT